MVKNIDSGKFIVFRRMFISDRCEKNIAKEDLMRKKEIDPLLQYKLGNITQQGHPCTYLLVVE